MNSPRAERVATRDGPVSAGSNNLAEAVKPKLQQSAVSRHKIFRSAPIRSTQKHLIVAVPAYKRCLLRLHHQHGWSNILPDETQPIKSGADRVFLGPVFSQHAQGFLTRIRCEAKRMPTCSQLERFKTRPTPLVMALPTDHHLLHGPEQHAGVKYNALTLCYFGKCRCWYFSLFHARFFTSAAATISSSNKVKATSPRAEGS